MARKPPAIPEAQAATKTQAAPKPRKRSAREAGLDPSDPPGTAVSKPEPYGAPPIWSTLRQSLCETLDYYHSYQGSEYVQNGFICSVLIDKDPEDGGYCDEEVVITRISGATPLDDDGEVKLDEEKRPRKAHLEAFKKNLEFQIPVYLIFGQGYQHSPSRLPHRYNVAGVFFITNIWATRTHQLFHQVRFEKADLRSKSWWAPIGSPLPPFERDFSRKASSQACPKCGNTYPQVFAAAWKCLNEDCSQHTRTNSMRLNPDFLEERTDHSAMSKPSAPLVPVLQTMHSPPSLDSSSRLRGIQCPKCKACCSRIHWTHWACETDGCGFKHRINHVTVPHTAFIGRLQHEVVGHALPTGECTHPIRRRSSTCSGHYRTTIFDFGTDCFVAHVQGNIHANGAARGPNNIFAGLQKAEGIPLERRAMTTGPMGRMLTNHYAANYGMPYRYTAKTDTPSGAFSTAPDSVIAALGRMILAAQKVVPAGSFQMPNEMLIVGYMTDNGMNYHHDGEEGLGPTVVSLSLGGEATMTFRMKAGYYNPEALSGKNVAKYDPKRKVVVGSKHWAERAALNESHGNVDDDEWEVAKEQLFSDYKTAKGRRTPPEVLSIVLKHGDYLIMHGSDIQKYYEHRLMSNQAFRFGVTARYIDAEMHNVPDEERHKAVYELGEDDLQE